MTFCGTVECSCATRLGPPEAVDRAAMMHAREHVIAKFRYGSLHVRTT